MRDYFTLQYRLINRQLSDFGIQPAIGYFLLAAFFCGFTAYLFYSTTYAAYVYALLGLSFTSMLSEAGRTGFLNHHFSRKDFLIIRSVENILVVLPFVIGLLIYHECVLAPGLLIISISLSLISIEHKLNIAIPTPFNRYPFEFSNGFRNNYPIILLAGFLLAMGVIYNNANLSLFSFALVILVCLMFYIQSETTYFVWIHSMSAKTFLFHKIKLAMMYATLMSIPFAAVVLFFFKDHAGYLGLVYGIGMVYLITVVLSKYAFFPSTMNLPQGLLIAFSFSFPPMLLFIIPYFYRRCIHQLNPILA